MLPHRHENPLPLVARLLQSHESDGKCQQREQSRKSQDSVIAESSVMKSVAWLQS